MMKRVIQISTLGFVTMGLFTGCESMKHEHGTAGGSMSKAKEEAVAVLSPASGSNVKGTVRFTKETEGIRVVADIQGLTPGPHGFHIHEKGDCSAPDATSAGGHFNPSGSPHGAPTAPQHHSGDFGNIEANRDGIVRFERVFNFLSMEGTNSIIGKAVIVHEKPDDLTTQPSGNAGARQACGVISKTSK